MHPAPYEPRHILHLEPQNACVQAPGQEAFDVIRPTRKSVGREGKILTSNFLHMLDMMQ
jgi:hypothetical protein